MERATDDRRREPRREVERKLHYARENLLAAALEFANGSEEVPVNLAQAANMYRSAEKEAQQ